jgi:hypothetical protein
MLLGYYVGYERDLLPPDEIDWSALTHLVVGPVLPQQTGTLDLGFDLADPSQGPDFARDLAQRAHDHGVVPLLMIGGAGAHDGFKAAASSKKRQQFVRNLVATLARSPACAARGDRRVARAWPARPDSRTKAWAAACPPKSVSATRRSRGWQGSGAILPRTSRRREGGKRREPWSSCRGGRSTCGTTLSARVMGGSRPPGRERRRHIARCRQRTSPDVFPLRLSSHKGTWEHF